MDFKLRKNAHPDINKTSEIPEEMHWLLQRGYAASYTHGKFGRMVSQYKTEGDFEMRCYYLHVWNPLEFYVVTNKPFISVFVSYTQDMVLRYSDLAIPLILPKSEMRLLHLHAYPRLFIVPMSKPGIYLTWHLSAPEKYQKQWLQFDALKKVTDKYKPEFDFTLRSKFQLRVPLAD